MIALQDMLNWFDQQEQEAVNAFHQNGGISINNNNNNDNNNPATTTTTTAAAISSSASNSSVSSLDRQEFRAGGHAFIAVYDATNSTRERRKTIYESCTSKGVQVMFIESVCDDMNIILSNIKEVQ